MVDYYALPQSGSKAWPGRAEATLLPFDQKASHIANALAIDIAEEMGGGFDAKRFVPNILMHEFEGLLFSDCAAFAAGIGLDKIAEDLQRIRDLFETPEHINDSPHTAPSKRIAALIPGYQKPIYGNLAIISVGLAKIQTECPNFREWLEKLEALGSFDPPL